MACHYFLISYRSCRGRDRMVVGFTTTYRYAIGAHQHESGEFESRSRQCELDTTLCDKFVNDSNRLVVSSGYSHRVQRSIRGDCYVKRGCPFQSG
jgi:hypothetical protein